MKLRSTTPASISFPGKALLVLSALVIAIAVPVKMLSQPVSADEYDDRISVLQKEIEQFKAESDRLNGEAASLQNALAQLASEKAAIQTQINLSQAQYNKLVADIADTEKQIANNQDVLGTTLANIYVDDQISPIELIASSSNIGDFLDKQEYRSSVRKELTATIVKIKDLKKSLTEKKVAVEKVLAEQKSQRELLIAKQNEQQVLLDKTKGDEANYRNMISNNQDAITKAKAAQAAMNARAASGGGYTVVSISSGSGYPWDSSNCWMTGYMSEGGSNGGGGDGHGYGCRQCVSYAAWRIAKETGIYYEDLGDGGTSGYRAIGHGYKDLGGTPQPGSIAVMLGSPGHVAWVEDVSPDGGKVLVSQYNYYYMGWGNYTLMWLPTSFFDQYVKIK